MESGVHPWAQNTTLASGWALPLPFSVMGSKKHVHAVNLLPAAGGNGPALYHHRWNEAPQQQWVQDGSMGYMVPRGWGEHITGPSGAFLHSQHKGKQEQGFQHWRKCTTTCRVGGRQVLSY